MLFSPGEALLKRSVLFFAFLFATGLSAANPDLLTRLWKAHWISVEGASPFDYGVYHFRRAFDLASKPSSFVIHVTADNRYQLFVNGERAVWGPARGDLFHWRYETVDIAQYLRAGRNVLAAVVWNDGQYRAVAQISHETGFLVQGDSAREEVVNTDQKWVGIQDRAYRPIPITYAQVNGYVAIPPGEEVNAAVYPWGWEQPDYDASSWKPAVAGRNGAPRDTVDTPNHWMLVPRSIPMPEQKPERLARVRKAEGVSVPSGFPSKPVALQAPARAKVKLLLDQNYETTAFPEMLVSGGRGARISLRYAEALWQPGRKGKGNRDEIEGKEFLGYQDVFLPDGGPKRLYRPLYWRTWRYIELTIETKDQPLTIEDLRGVYTGYPFVRKARFDAGSEEFQKILDVGWRTARLCGHETYMDCPYYEQLQYVGDTRIQALVSLYMTGDHRLVRNAIEQINSSRTPEGATYSRAPSALQQYIPPFSLWWIGMVHDYWMYVDDPEFVKQMLPGVRAVLSFYASYQKPNGSLRRMPWWNYVDWVERWPRGMPPMEEDGSSAAINLQLLLAYRWASELEAALGWKQLSGIYRAEAEKLRATVREQYWDSGRGLFADTPRHTQFSQHANALAVLAGVSTGAEARQVMERAIADQSLAPASIYFRYYLHLAMRKAGLGDRYIEMLGPWRKMLSDGLTTWAERDSFRVRSDCHAWGASPNIELFRIVAGIDSAAPGFRRVTISPHLGKLERVSASIPHPKGEIAVLLELRNGKLHAEVTLPEGVEGEFHWRGATRALGSGRTELDL
jgi:alpha-L-rhamnosidase